MKTNPIYPRENPLLSFPFHWRSLYNVLSCMLLALVLLPAQAQPVEYTRPSLWLGVAAGANANFYRGTTQQLDNDFTSPVAFRHGKGLGLYLAPLIELHRPGNLLGVMLQVGYDGRSGTFDTMTTPCNCPADLSATLNYLTIEPSLRFSPFRSGFYVFAGPRFAFNREHSYTYQLGINPDFPDQEPNEEVNGEFSDVHKSVISMQIGAGFDIPLSSSLNRSQAVLSPFVALHPYFGQQPRSTETWSLTTIRVGAALKFGRGREVSTPVATPDVVTVRPLTIIAFTVDSPENIPVERNVRETFPLRNYVYFDLNSTKISDRYTLLEKSQVKDFKEDQLEALPPNKLSERASRNMAVYYNLLNILGDRMNKVPSANITLVGSSEQGVEDAKAMAGSIKTYLVDVFGINASRITIEGLDKPKIPSRQAGGTLELKQLREDDRRVSIESSSPAMLMEFRTGPDAPLKPVEIVGVQTAPIDSYVTFHVPDAKTKLSSWTVEVKDEYGVVQNFGPYYQDKVSIPGKTILGTRPSGDYQVTLLGKTLDNQVVKKETKVHMVLWTPPTDQIGMRYNVIYEFNDSESIAIYEKYLSEVVTPKIPKNAHVFVHGYSDAIGESEHNLVLSQARADNVKKILEKSLAKAGRTDVKIESLGFGEDNSLSPFNNKYPEERAYNRTVLIDIFPPK
jgi:outer membrane protein OmpA-like peptidoglycan-associated protein